MGGIPGQARGLMAARGLRRGGGRLATRARTQSSSTLNARRTGGRHAPSLRGLVRARAAGSPAGDPYSVSHRAQREEPVLPEGPVEKRVDTKSPIPETRLCDADALPLFSFRPNDDAPAASRCGPRSGLRGDQQSVQVQVSRASPPSRDPSFRNALSGAMTD